MFRRLVGFVLLMVISIVGQTAEPIGVYFGTYTGGPSKGIYRAVFDTATGRLSDLTLVGETENPSFLAVHPQLPVLYSVSEVRAGGERKGASLVAWKIGSDGKLTEFGRIASGGDGPCHVSVSPNGKFAAMANYSSGSATLVTLDANGTPIAADTVKHSGSSGAVPQRQEGPHAHCARFSPQGDLLCITDLGLDQVRLYRFSDSKLSAASPPFVATAAGAGPRHMRFTPDGRWLVVINELGNTVATYRFDAGSGSLSATATAATLPDDFQGSNTTAEVCVHPNGKFVYGSNRGHDSIAVFALDPASGKLETIEIKPAGVKTPRNFNLLDQGRWLIAVGQDSNDAQVFRVDPATGRLTAHGERFEVPKSVCVLPLEK